MSLRGYAKPRIELRMLKARVIPCLDVKDGRVVKGVNFVNLRDAGDPVEQARLYDANGADELCFLDITASVENRGIILDVVRATTDHVFMPVTVGGGIRELQDIEILLNAGPTKSRHDSGGKESGFHSTAPPINVAASASSP